MMDLLVPLFLLPERCATAESIIIRTAFPSEIPIAKAWVAHEFGENWASEFEYAAKLSPIRAHLAVENGAIVGFACYDAAARGVFGPTGVSEKNRGRGIGTALLLRTLNDMRALGYAYAVIGGAGPVEYYERTVGAFRIECGSPSFLESIVKGTSRDISR